MGLKEKYGRFSNLSKKKKKRDKEIKAAALAKANEPKQAPLTQPILKKDRKRRYAQFAKYEVNNVCNSNPRKKLKRTNQSFRNRAGYSPSISFRKSEKTQKPKSDQ